MHKVHDLSLYRESEASIRKSDVAGALRYLGGAAHRDAITDVVKSNFGGRFSKLEVQAAVDAYLLQDRQGQFRQVFGPQSYRWALAN